MQYNYYGSRMNKKRDGDLRELLAEARAIFFAMAQGATTSRQAKDRTKPLLQKINIAIEVIAKKHNQKPKYITFSDLGKNI